MRGSVCEAYIWKYHEVIEYLSMIEGCIKKSFNICEWKEGSIIKSFNICEWKEGSIIKPLNTCRWKELSVLTKVSIRFSW